MTKLRKEFSVACNGKVPNTYRFPAADLVLFTCCHQTMLSKIRKFSSKIDSGLFTKITTSPPKYRHLHQKIEFSTKICGAVFEQLARYTMKYQESDLHLGLYISYSSYNFYLLYFYSTSPSSTLLTSSSTVAVLIAKAGHVWVS